MIFLEVQQILCSKLNNRLLQAMYVCKNDLIEVVCRRRSALHTVYTVNFLHSRINF